MALPALDAKNGEIPPLQPHWIFDGEPDSPNYTGSLMQRLVLATYRTLCMVTFAENSLRPIWVRNHMEDPEAREHARDVLRERIQHTNIVVRFFGFNVGRSFSISRRAVCCLRRSRPSAARIRRRILNSSRTRRRDLRASCSLLSRFPWRVSFGSTIVAVITKAQHDWFCNVSHPSFLSTWSYSGFRVRSCWGRGLGSG